MLRTMLLTAALAVGATAVLAQGDPIATRKQTMKGVGDATKIGSAMAKGEAPFDAAKAKEILAVYANAADKMHNYFPENSKTGGETTAAPTIWQNQAEFRKRFDDWAAEIKKASAQTDNLDSFKAAFGNLTKACGGCHETFRIKKS
ncbi:MAG TPA: cytochrome c [Beijerinckiaceae bacterium]|jgi:cytochrome c556